jgi:hypothetical protein
MALVPRITSPCPLRFSSMPAEGKDFCGKCERRVHNLDGMSQQQRQEFFASCGGDVCVAYTVQWPQRLARSLRAGAVAAVALSASSMALGQDAAPVDSAASAPIEDVVTGPTCDPNHDLESITVGGVQGIPAFVDVSELDRPEAPSIGEIEAAEWLPSPKSE